jgi:protein-tyrosine sulfotransferase
MKYEKLFPVLLPASKIIQRHKIIIPNQKLSCTPFFILGSGRNGSTLISSMLNQHSKIVIPPEQFFLHLSYIRFRLLNFLEWKDIVKIIFGEAMNPKVSPYWDIELGNVIPQMYDLPKNERSLTRLIDEVFTNYSKKQKSDFQIWGDKTPKNILYIKYIHKMYPNSKFIFLKRDGRDVVSSYLKGETTFFGDYNKLENACAFWNKSFESWDWLIKRLKEDQMMTINYEDLVTDGKTTLTNATKFIGFEFEEEMLSSYQKQANVLGISDAPHHQNVKGALSSNSIGKWKERMTQEQIVQTEKLIGKNLERFKYI